MPNARWRALALVAVAVTTPILCAAQDGPAGSGALTVTGFGPEYAALVTGPDSAAVSAYMTRSAAGEVALEWSIGLPADAFATDARSATLAGLSPGVYVVRWWSGQVRMVGKTLLTGPGVEQRVTVGSGPALVPLHAPDGIAAPTRLNVVWGRVAAPNDVSVSVDGIYIGHAFDSAELSVFGLPKGERRVRVTAPGYRPVDLTVSLSTRHETTRFVRMRRLDDD
ncbi:PEGA domain-containing protein [Candidatus Poribacteria bacterium]|nr:PEGA domain-containing protein [Candidatus Poribacteria bacterium]MBT5535380.1 PEGA domain-containing protein [Candidatus Poribacteria bacterium]MBT5713470.1 PEGA domain-containing protein [Candidatus Poribacteria bacterium]MBT7805272.1 PEGA domain-containing protein [Candidatus Poribacteria bacterium]